MSAKQVNSKSSESDGIMFGCCGDGFIFFIVFLMSNTILWYQFDVGDKDMILRRSRTLISKKKEDENDYCSLIE